MSTLLLPTGAEHAWRGLPPSLEPSLETIHLCAIEDAIRLLNTKATELACGSTAIWRLVDHARRHLEKQLEAAVR